VIPPFYSFYDFKTDAAAQLDGHRHYLSRLPLRNRQDRPFTIATPNPAPGSGFRVLSALQQLDRDVSYY